MEDLDKYTLEADISPEVAEALEKLHRELPGIEVVPYDQDVAGLLEFIDSLDGIAKEPNSQKRYSGQRGKGKPRNLLLVDSQGLLTWLASGTLGEVRKFMRAHILVNKSSEKDFLIV